MRIHRPVAVAVFASFINVAGSGMLPAFGGAPLPPILGGKVTQTAPASPGAPRPVVRYELRIEQFTPLDPAVARVADVVAPTILGTPTVTTLDHDTATIAVTNTSFSYAIALSPIIENARPAGDNGAAKTVDGIQTSWNVRLTGKSLPAGTTAVTLTGATRFLNGKSAILSEITLREAESGKATVYRIWATVTLPQPDAPGS